MNSTYYTLFTLLRAALHGDEIPEVPNFSVLLQEARKQTVDGLLYGLPECRDWSRRIAKWKCTLYD